MTATLKNHPIWQTLNQTLAQLDPIQIATQHLQACNAQINGYWDEDEFYEVISFTQPPHLELTSIAWELLPNSTENPHWLQLKFEINATQPINFPASHDGTQPRMGDLTLILDENLEVIDENWFVNLQSPYILAVR